MSRLDSRTKNIPESGADPKATETPHLGRSLPYLDLSVIPTADSCGTVECNVDLNLSSQKQPDLAAPKTMWDSLDSTSRNNATVLHELSPPEICKDDDKVSPLFSKEITPKKQCMQLFSEEKTSDIFRSVTTQPVAAASIASGQRRNSSDVQPIPASAHFLSRTVSLKPENLSEMQHSSLPRAIYRHCEETWKGQLGCYVKGSKIALLIMEGGRDLAERWEEEQSKLLSGICVPQFKYSIAQGKEVMPGGGHYSSRLMFAIMAMNTSRGLLGAQRTSHFGFRREKYDEDEFSILSRSRSMAKGNLLSTNGPTTCVGAKGNLPHWLRECFPLYDLSWFHW
ncbi:unnamed protein product [Prunus armeniaca]